MENIYEKILYIKNKPLFEKTISFSNHKIFYKYTSTKYYKYIFNLLDTLSKRSSYENKSHIFHLSLTFIFKILFQCGNTPHLSNLDLITLNCFSLCIKSLTKQKMFPSITKIKNIYQEKYNSYTNKEILEGEIVCLKLLNYNINILTPFEYVEYITCDNSDILFKNQAKTYLENMILNELEFILYNTPFDIAKRCINELKNNIVTKEPKIIIKKIISTKNFHGKGISKKNSSSDKMIISKDESINLKNINMEIINKLKRKNNISNSQSKQKIVMNNIYINVKCSPEKIYFKKNCNYNNYNNIIHQNSSESIIADNNYEKNKVKIFKKKINRISASKNKCVYNNNLYSTNKDNNDEISKKKLNLNNDIKKINKSYYDKNVLNISNNIFFRKTNNIRNYQPSKENDKNYQNFYILNNNSGSRNINITNNNKYSVESENINNYKSNRILKYEIETKNIKLGYLNKKNYCGSDYKRTNNNGSRLTQIHSRLNSSANFFDNSPCSKDDNIFENQSIGNYYIKW